MKHLFWSAALLTTASIGKPSVPAASSFTIITGVVRAANLRTALSGARIEIGTNLTVVADDSGRFSVRVPRDVAFIRISNPGYLTFEYPVLQLTTDTLHADVEMRTSPRQPANINGRLSYQFLCIVLDSPDQFVVLDRCREPQLSSAYHRTIIKHNPWSLYFGETADIGGVLIASRVVASARTAP